MWTELSWAKGPEITLCNSEGQSRGWAWLLVFPGGRSQGNQKTDTSVLLNLSPEDVSQIYGLLMARSPFSETSSTEDVIFIITRLSKSRNSFHPCPSKTHFTLQRRIYWKLSLITHLDMGISLFKFCFLL